MVIVVAAYFYRLQTKQIYFWQTNSAQGKHYDKNAAHISCMPLFVCISLGKNKHKTRSALISFTFWYFFCLSEDLHKTHSVFAIHQLRNHQLIASKNCTSISAVEWPIWASWCSWLIRTVITITVIIIDKLKCNRFSSIQTSKISWRII